jgi:hypothetical protein
VTQRKNRAKRGNQSTNRELALQVARVLGVVADALEAYAINEPCVVSSVGTAGEVVATPTLTEPVVVTDEHRRCADVVLRRSGVIQ